MNPHEAEQFLRYLLECASLPEFDLPAHVPKIKRILGEEPVESKDQLKMFTMPSETK